MNKNTKEITLVGVMIALGVVLSAMLRIPLFANVRLDLSYIVITVAIMKCGMFGSMMVAGSIALLESTIFGVNGLSLPWVLANVVIAFVASIFYKMAKEKGNNILFYLGIVLGCFLGLVIVKSLVETLIANIPLIIRITSNLVAFAGDLTCMIIGVFIGKRFVK